MKQFVILLRRVLPYLAAAAVLLVLWAISRHGGPLFHDINSSNPHGYLFFHVLAELFSIIVACAIFLVAWNARRFMERDYLLFLGIAYLFVAVIDLMHTLAYNGMNVFSITGANLATQLWIGARALQAAALLIAPVFLTRRLNPYMALAGSAVAAAAVLCFTFGVPLFPGCFVDGVGPTTFKILSEYVICGMMGIGLVLLVGRRRLIDDTVWRLIAASIIVTIVSEIAFTQYVGVFGLANFLGHYLKIIAFYLLYRALVVTGLRRPYDLLFRDLVERTAALHASEQRLGQLTVDLEDRVLERTALLERRTAQLREMAMQLTQAEQRERHRLAQVLHDHLQQLLAAAKLRASLTRAKLSDDALKDAVLQVEDMIQESIDASRSLAYELSPPVLHEFGLGPALAWLGKWMREKHGLVVQGEFEEVLPAAELEEINTFLFQAAREILFNVVKHAGVNRARVRLKSTPENELHLVIEDDGGGFDAEKYAAEGSDSGFGLFGIRERIGLLGGRLEIRSAPGQGCTFTLCVPLPGGQ